MCNVTANTPRTINASTTSNYTANNTACATVATIGSGITRAANNNTTSVRVAVLRGTRWYGVGSGEFNVRAVRVCERMLGGYGGGAARC